MPTMSTPSAPSQLNKLGFYSLFREYNLYNYFPLTPSDSQYKLSIVDICILSFIYSFCCITNSNPLEGHCTHSDQTIAQSFLISEKTVKRSLSNLEKANLISIIKPYKGIRQIKLLKDFSISNSIVSQQLNPQQEKYEHTSSFIKLYKNSFNPEYLKNRELSLTDIVIYNIIYSQAIYSKDMTTKISHDDIEIWIPISQNTISRSFANLKYYDLIQINPQAGKVNEIQIINDIVTGSAEEFIIW